MTLNKFQHRVEVFKKASGGTCDKDTVILALEAQDMNSVRIKNIQTYMPRLEYFS